MELWEARPLVCLSFFPPLPPFHWVGSPRRHCDLHLGRLSVRLPVFITLDLSAAVALSSSSCFFLGLFRLSLKCLMVSSWDASWDHSYPGDLSQNQALLSAKAQILRALDLLPRSHCCSLTSSSIPVPTPILSFFIITCFRFSYNIFLNMDISY